MDPISQKPISIDIDLTTQAPKADNNESILVLTEEQLVNLSKAILGDIESYEYDFHVKVLKDAQAFIQRKLNYYGYNTKVYFPKDTTKEIYIKNPANQEPYERLGLDLPFSWYQTKVPKKVISKIISELNKEFNLERRFGLFLLEEYSNSYSIHFNPNPMAEKAFDYLNSDRLLFGKLALETFHPLDRLNKD